MGLLSLLVFNLWCSICPNSFCTSCNLLNNPGMADSWDSTEYTLSSCMFPKVCGLSGAKTTCRRQQRDVTGVWESCAEVFECWAIRKWYQICEVLHQMCKSDSNIILLCSSHTTRVGLLFLLTWAWLYSVLQASFYSDPMALYACIYSKGIGTRTAALYVAWAQQFEQRGVNEQAEAVYQKAMENQAQPADTVLNEYR